jgi:hypothetical protein
MQVTGWGNFNYNLKKKENPEPSVFMYIAAFENVY